MIKLNVEMPISCVDCFALTEDEIHNYKCRLLGQTVNYKKFWDIISKRPAKMDNCPLQEDTSTLKPCPFCGSAVEIKRHPLWQTNSDGQTHGYKDCYKLEISCPECGCSTNRTKSDTVSLTEDQAKNIIAENWNTRSEK